MSSAIEMICNEFNINVDDLEKFANMNNIYISTNKIKEKVKKEKVNKVKKPKAKRVISGYQLYSNSVRSEMTIKLKAEADTKGETYTTKSVTTAVGHLWTALNDEDKNEWKAKAKIATIERNDANSDSDENTTIVNDDKPKRNPSGYNLFMKAEMLEINQNIEKLTEESDEKPQPMKIAGARWSSLSDEEKKVWNDKSKFIKEENKDQEKESDDK